MKQIAKLGEDQLTVKDGNWRPYFETFWPIIDWVLGFLISMRWTKEKADKILSEIRAIGSDISNDTADPEQEAVFFGYFAEFWPSINSVLEWVKVFTGSKIDNVIEKFQAFGQVMLEAAND